MQQRRRVGARAFATALVGLGIGSATAGFAQSLDQLLAQQGAADQEAAAAQREVDRLSDEAQSMADKYRQALADAASLEKYNEQLAQQVKSQADEVASIRQQLAQIETTEREVQPLMRRMVETLAQFVTLDAPFLLEERTKRVAGLQDMMGRADVTISEKYRRILEAYQIEMEYGRTLEAWEGQLGEGEAARTVEFVRVGRASLMYQTLDGDETGYWDPEKKAWVADDDWRDEVAEALRVARQRGAPDLLVVPVRAAGEAQS